MQFENNVNAMFCDPNAYIQRYEKKEQEKKTEKVVFSEPYETLPNYYIDNHFKKHNCDCIPKLKNDKNGDRCGCDNCLNGGHLNNYQCNSNHDCKSNHGANNVFGFDFKNILPLLGLFNKGGGADLSGLIKTLNNNNDSSIESNSTAMNLISSLMSNKNMMSGIMNLFSGGGLNLFNKKSKSTKEIKTTDYEIKNYTRVE